MINGVTSVSSPHHIIQGNGKKAGNDAGFCLKLIPLLHMCWLRIAGFTRKSTDPFDTLWMFNIAMENHCMDRLIALTRPCISIYTTAKS